MKESFFNEQEIRFLSKPLAENKEISEFKRTKNFEIFAREIATFYIIESLSANKKITNLETPLSLNTTQDIYSAFFAASNCPTFIRPEPVSYIDIYTFFIKLFIVDKIEIIDLVEFISFKDELDAEFKILANHYLSKLFGIFGTEAVKIVFGKVKRFAEKINELEENIK